MSSEKISFKNTQGQTLVGRLDLPDTGASAYALFAHCFTCSKDALAVSRISRGLMERGIGVLRFDFTGLGESEGSFDSTSFASNIDDLHAACAWMAREHGEVGLLIGHSLGGAAVLAAAGEMQSVRGVVTIGAPSDPAHVRKLFEAQLDEIEREGSAMVSIGGRPFRVGKALVDDLSAQNPEESVSKLGRPLLIFHSPIDRVVGVENAADLFGWAMHPKSFVSLDQADHMLSDRKDADFVAGIISAWSQRFVVEG